MLLGKNRHCQHENARENAESFKHGGKDGKPLGLSRLNFKELLKTAGEQRISRAQEKWGGWFFRAFRRSPAIFRWWLETVCSSLLAADTFRHY